MFVQTLPRRRSAPRALRASLVKPPVSVWASQVPPPLPRSPGLSGHQSRSLRVFLQCLVNPNDPERPGRAAVSGTGEALPACTAGLDFVTEDLNPCFKGNKEFDSDSVALVAFRGGGWCRAVPPALPCPPSVVSPSATSACPLPPSRDGRSVPAPLRLLSPCSCCHWAGLGANWAGWEGWCHQMVLPPRRAVLGVTPETAEVPPPARLRDAGRVRQLHSSGGSRKWGGSDPCADPEGSRTAAGCNPWAAPR